MGEYVGEVTWCNSVRMELRTDKVLHNGDGFCFINENGELKGLRADVVSGKTISCNRPHGATRGTKIYRNFDIEWQKQVDASNGNRKIDIQLTLEENEKGYEFIASIDDGRDAPWHISKQTGEEDAPWRVSTTAECEKIIANNPEKATENIRKKALQWGDTIFNPVDLKLDFSQPYLIPASVIGEMKRNLVEKLMDYLVENHKNNRPHRDAPWHVSTNYPETELSYLGNVTNALAAEFYRQHGVTEIEDGLEKSYSKQSGIKVMTTKHCIRYANGMCSKETGKRPHHLSSRTKREHFASNLIAVIAK